MSRGVTLDAGALIGLERQDRTVLVLLAKARAQGARVTVPTTALAQVARILARQARLASLLRHSATDVVPLAEPDAVAVGALLAATRTADIVDAHVVLCARRAGSTPILTSDPEDLRRLDPRAMLVTV